MESTSPLPDRDQPGSGFPLIGREAEMRALRADLDLARSGQGRVVLLSGEPGIGKTRTAMEFSAIAESHDALVLWGHCQEWDGAPAYWPWMDPLRSAISSLDGADPTISPEDRAVAIATLLPEIRQYLSTTANAPSLEPEQARFQMFDGIRSFLRDRAAERPLLLILDDLHWADEPSLLLLQFVARGIGDSRLLILGTYRDTEMDRHALGPTLAGLARDPHNRQITLRGLAERDVAGYIRQVGGDDASGALVETIYTKTDGNPFFVVEMTRLLAAEGRLTNVSDGGLPPRHIPDSVREAIRRRLDRLPEECNRLLLIASVVGREFSTRILAHVADQSIDTIFDQLDVASRTRLIDELTTQGQYRFSHALIQETLYEEIGTSRRLRLHKRVGEAIEELHAADIEAYVSELAHHFLSAAPTGTAAKAITYATRAAERSIAQYAWELAIRNYGKAIQILEAEPERDAAQYCNLLLALGEMQNRVAAGRPRGDITATIGAGGSPGGLATFWQAAEVARAAGLHEQLAIAALGVVGFNPNAQQGGIEGVRLVEDALTLLAPHDSQLRARLLARAGIDRFMLAFHGKLPLEPGEDSHVLARNAEALAMARRLGDPTTIAYVLIMHNVQEPLYSVHQRLAWASEVVAIASAGGDPQTLLWGLRELEYALIQIGDIAKAHAVLERRTTVSDQVRLPFFAWSAAFGQIGLALRTGRFADAERWIERAEEIQPRSGVVTSQLITLRREQGRLAEQMILIDRQRIVPDALHVRSLRIICLLESGQVNAARAAFERAVSDAAADRTVPLRALSWLAEACATLGDSTRAAQLYDRLIDNAHYNVITGASDLTGGSCSYYLGLLATAMSEWDLAERHFADALEMNERWDVRPFVAHTRYHWAHMLTQRDAPGDQNRATELARDALALAEDIGMAHLAADVHALIERPTSRHGQPARARNHGLSPREIEVLHLIAAGSTDREIAEMLFISPRTAERHVSNIFNKLGVSSRAAAAVMAVREGLA